MMRRTFLAWHNLVHDKAKSLVAVAGVSFALIAIFMQSGFFQSVLRTATIVTDKLDYQVIIVSSNYLYLAEPGSFPRPYLEQARAVPGVRAVSPFYVGTSTWRAAQPVSAHGDADPSLRHQRRPVMVLGFDLADQPFRSDGPFRAEAVTRQRQALQETDAILVDRRCRPEFGPIDVGVRPEVGLRRYKVVGRFTMGTGFAADGAIIVGDQTFAKLCGRRALARPSLGLVQLEPGADPDAVARQLALLYPSGDVQVLTRDAFRAGERWYWSVGKPIGVIFVMGVAVAFLVGAVVAYHVLSSDIADHHAEYATLKAMGYSSGDLARVVLEEGLIVAAASYVPSLLVSWALYRVVAARAVIPIDMHAWIAVPILISAAAMCTLSAAVAIGKVIRTDPADIY
jgi:putative ABC transport system permease protein